MEIHYQISPEIEEQSNKQEEVYLGLGCGPPTY
jgi:hypothetical protein